jgi:tRNA pseudouridine(55) synthase
MLPPYIVLNKRVGETPLECMEAYRATQPTLMGIPMAYAGRLDPMASGKLLVLVGDTCKYQSDYHGLDKAYEVDVLVGAHSDSGDVLGIVTEQPKEASGTDWQQLASSLIGEVTLPYPAYSAKTVSGIPLHTWAVTGRIGEITIPERTSTIYRLVITKITTQHREDIYQHAIKKISLLPTVTDERKALGNDFRRTDVLASWSNFKSRGTPADQFTLVQFSCICSSGTYMRTLADVIATKAGSRGLAFSIHRTDIGAYGNGTWQQRYTD